jgi:hypothetical protein
MHPVTPLIKGRGNCYILTASCRAQRWTTSIVHGGERIGVDPRDAFRFSTTRPRQSFQRTVPDS